MLSCKQVTDKLSAQIDGELPLLDRLTVRFHQFMCSDCKQAAVNLGALVGSMKGRPPLVAVPPDENGIQHHSERELEDPDSIDEEFIDRIMDSLPQANDDAF